MGTQQPQSDSQVASLEELIGHAPHQARIERIKRWHIDQATSPDPNECAVHVSITSAGEIYSAALAVEPEHAQILLPHIEELAAMLRECAARGAANQDKITRRLLCI